MSQEVRIVIIDDMFIELSSVDRTAAWGNVEVDENGSVRDFIVRGTHNFAPSA